MTPRRAERLQAAKSKIAVIQRALQLWTKPVGSCITTGMTDSDDSGLDPIAIPIDGMLDLHTFRPRDVKHVVSDYLDECRQKGILHVRIVHGKGIGALRTTVHALLEKRTDVVEFHLAGSASGGWGATIVHLRPCEDSQG
jgi:DNA-nicking Smr family endonuclease